MNPKIDKVARDIERTKKVIIDSQERLRELEQQKINMENTEIIALFRSSDIPLHEIKAVIQSYEENYYGYNGGVNSNTGQNETPAAADVINYRPSGGQYAYQPDEEEETDDEE